MPQNTPTLLPQYTQVEQLDNSVVPIGGAAAAAGAGFLSKFIQGEQNRKAQAEENRLNREWANEQRNQQNTWNLDQYNRNNLYNSAAEQYKRYKDSGLNPALMQAGQPVSAIAPKASQAANGVKQKVLPIQAGAALMTTLDAYMKKAQIDNIKADTNAKITGEAYTGYKAEGQQNQNRITKIAAGLAEEYGRKKFLADIGLTTSRTDLVKAQKLLSEAQADLANSDANLRKIGLQNSDNIIIRMMGQYGARNPTEAATLLQSLINAGNNLY